MQRRTLRLFVCVLGLGLLPLLAQGATQNPAQIQAPAAVMPTPPAPNPGAHIALTGAVMQALSNAPTVGAYTITANVTDDGAVALNGVVPTQSVADAAVQVVKAVPGVKSVTSQILVNQDPFAPANAAGVASIAPAASAAPASEEPQSRISNALAANPALARVSAVVYDRQIVLIGTVTSSKDSDAAVQIARKTLPGYPINNTIWVEPHPMAPAPKIPRS